MIDRISQQNGINRVQYSNQPNDRLKKEQNSPSFGSGLSGAFPKKVQHGFIKGIQQCEKNPMINVAVIDLSTAIFPRSIWESMTNIFAGLEAFRREASGLFINCLLPGVVALGAGKLVNNLIVGKQTDLSTCWAGKDGINTISEFYQNAHETPSYIEGMAKFNDPQKARVYAAHYNMLSCASGVDGNEVKKFSKVAGLDRSLVAEKLTQATFEEAPKLTFSQRIAKMFSKSKAPKPISALDEAYHTVVNSTHISQNVTFESAKNSLVSDLKPTMTNATKLMRGFVKEGAINPEQIASLSKRAKKLVNAKSGIAMAVIIPLAASAQYINRWITTKTSGVKGAPIYNDFAKDAPKVIKTPEQEKEDKQKLLKQKFISIGSMIGVACLSMMKLPTLSTLKNIFQFKGPFPTMDQARAISTVTFCSRMAAADDKNELAEATGRDIVTFSSMYFLGDYAAKGYATHLEKSEGVKLLNNSKPLDKNANVFKKIGNWIVNTKLKSTDELVANATHSLEDMKTLRAKCQMANLGSSLLILGLLVPIYTRMKTAKNHKKDLEAANSVNFTSNHVQTQQKLTKTMENGNFKTFLNFKHTVES